MTKWNKTSLIALILFILSALFSLKVQATDKLPEPLVSGGVTVTQGTGVDQKTFYGGFTGNETVLNYNTSGQTSENKSSFSLDGSTDYAQTESSIFSASSINTMSVSLWFKNGTVLPDPAVTKSWKYLFQQWEYKSAIRLGGNQDIDLIGWGYSSTIDNYPPGSPGNEDEIGITNASVRNTNWHHLVVTKDASKIYVYLDGSKIGNQNGYDVDHQINTGKATVGFGYSGGWKYYNGNMDEVLVYDRALTSTDVSDLRQGKIASSPKLYWNFSDLENGSTVDKSVNDYDGVVYGGDTAPDSTTKPPISAENPGPELFGFDQANLIGCINGLLLKPATYNCFVKNSSASGINVMNSKTYFNNTPILEVATLLYPSKSIVGDVYGSLSNFSYWGRNLNQNNNTSLPSSPEGQASWRIAGPINSNAQAKIDGEQFKSYLANINIMSGEATAVKNSDLSPSTWYLDTTNVNIGTDATADSKKAKYPEGRVWLIDCSVSGSCTSGAAIFGSNVRNYQGQGTIIIKGNLTFNANATLTANNSDSKLGFIVFGDVAFNGNNKIDATILAYEDGSSNVGTITASGDNSTFKGSFVAENFVASGNNVRFYYDYNLDNAWPPGFKYFKMPSPAENK